MKRAGMEDLSNIVRVRRLTMAGHILQLAPDRPASVAMHWVPNEGSRKRGHSRHGDNIPGRFTGDASQQEWCPPPS